MRETVLKRSHSQSATGYRDGWQRYWQIHNFIFNGNRDMFKISGSVSHLDTYPNIGRGTREGEGRRLGRKHTLAEQNISTVGSSSLCFDLEFYWAKWPVKKCVG
ncbi:hypothetical protein M5K25_012710 [Dendrobium thyrsiflorum]|uniref:Uncharacterized protein n=1 Tax=Dendrobium thyrsiflorum TaxID=117978 RepID=A0ABD0UYF3_DENTH